MSISTMDVLDPSEVSGHPLTAPEGPTSHELAAALEVMFQHKKAGAIGIASMPFGERDKPCQLQDLDVIHNTLQVGFPGVLNAQHVPYFQDASLSVDQTLKFARAGNTVSPIGIFVFFLLKK